MDKDMNMDVDEDGGDADSDNDSDGDSDGGELTCSVTIQFDSYTLFWLSSIDPTK